MEKLKQPTITEVILHFKGVSIIKTFEGRQVSLSVKDIEDYTALIHGNYFIVTEDASYCVWRWDIGYAEIVGVSTNLVVQKRKALLIIGVALSCTISGLVSTSTDGTLHQLMFGIAAGLLGSLHFMSFSKKYGFTFFRK